MIYNNKILSSHGNRGMDLENDINSTNAYYLNNNIAIIYKKPTPIRVNKVIHYKTKSVITDAFYEKQSTTDYNGIYKGKYIDFDAKEVKNNNNFALSNLHAHQLEHLKKVLEHGGISFIIVRFNKCNTTYLLETKEIINFLEKETRKSIPIEYFEKCAYKIKYTYVPKIDYIKIIDEIYFSNMEDVWKIK